jgi:hypothetical protein
MAARMPMMAITIISSIKVKPFFCFNNILFSLLHLLILVGWSESFSPISKPNFLTASPPFGHLFSWQILYAKILPPPK